MFSLPLPPPLWRSAAMPHTAACISTRRCMCPLCSTTAGTLALHLFYARIWKQCEWREYNVLHQHGIINDDDDGGDEDEATTKKASTRLLNWIVALGQLWTHQLWHTRWFLFFFLECAFVLCWLRAFFSYGMLAEINQADDERLLKWAAVISPWQPTKPNKNLQQFMKYCIKKKQLWLVGSMSAY